MIRVGIAKANRAEDQPILRDLQHLVQHRRKGRDRGLRDAGDPRRLRRQGKGGNETATVHCAIGAKFGR